jgi:hypothetical protein
MVQVDKFVTQAIHAPSARASMVMVSDSCLNRAEQLKDLWCELSSAARA